MNICDVVSFSNDRFFNGAIQTEWFYDEKRSDSVASNYIFHGPRYYGITSDDISSKQHKLIDTASFTRKLSEKINANSDNNFILTIAGYGTGKSHLAVCLGELFSGRNPGAVKRIIENIEKADSDIASQIEKELIQKNLVIVINGMNNFNLDSEVLSKLKTVLSSEGVDIGFLKEITKSYDIARIFIENMFDSFTTVFEKHAKNHLVKVNGTKLKDYLLNNLEIDQLVLEIVNEAYYELNGDSISWDRGLSAGDVLEHVQKHLCGVNKPYGKLLILFDEFGRYIEYASANPTIAGDAALQQIFEAVQNASGKIIFVGFIQNDLSAYLSRMENTSNIVRYVGRYDTSEKYYLSSNFETILANALHKSDSAQSIMDRAYDKYSHYYNSIYESINRWDKNKNKKSVWTNSSLYRNVIFNGCYPMHPITTWILSNTSSWMQQRSTIAFSNEMFQTISQQEIDGLWLPFVYPINIVDSSIFNEMLNSEEKGLVQSQYCMLYREIMQKVGDKLTEEQNNVLKAVFIINIAKFSFSSKNDAELAIRFSTGYKEEIVSDAMKTLEDYYGVISFDENTNTYDLIAEASGYNEFRRVMLRSRLNLEVSLADMDEDLLKELSLYSPVETSFAQEKNINSLEWCFERKLINADDITEQYINSLIYKVNNRFSGEEPRGILLYSYCCDDYENAVQQLSKLYKKYSLKNYPIIILMLHDEQSEMLAALKNKVAAIRLSSSEKERFQKYYGDYCRKQNKRIIDTFTKLVLSRKTISDDGEASYSERINSLCTQCFKSIFYKAPPFAFDGFQNRSLVQAKKYLTNICIKLYDRSLMNIQSYQALTQDEKNRIRSCLSISSKNSWRIFDDNCYLVEPQNELMYEIFSGFEDRINDKKPVNVKMLAEPYLLPPYGMNIYSISLFVMYYIALHGNELYCMFGEKKLSPSDLSDRVFKGGKVQINELNRINLIRNTNVEKDIVSELCKKALSCKCVEECGALRRQLDDVLVHEGISAENQKRVELARKKLEFGISIVRRNYDYLDKAKELVRDAKREFVIHRFYKVFDYIIDFSKPYSDEYDMTSEKKTIEAFNEVRNEIDQLMNSRYKKSLSHFSCKITQLSSVKATYKKVASVLRENNYIELADVTDKRMEQLEIELVAKSKYETSFVELDKDLSICDSSNALTYKETEDWLSKFEGWINFISTVKSYPKEELDNYTLKVNRIVENLKNRKAYYDELYKSIKKNYGAATSIEDLATIKRDITTLQTSIPPVEMQNEINAILENIKNIGNAILNLPDDVDELQIKITSYSEPVIVNEIRNRLAQMELEEKAWVEMYLLSINKDQLNNMTAISCSDWLTKTNPLPRYVSAKTKNEYSLYKQLIDKRLHECKVDGVVSLFSTLSEEEQQMCWEILKKKFEK